jgi:GT2 family glycosyltransferase
MELSVVLPCYNGARTIGAQLEALAAQEWDGDWEVVVVDNRSTDDTRAVVEGYRDRLPALRLVDAFERQGIAFALNEGVAEAAGDLIVFCNDDDEVAEGWLAAMGDALRQDEVVAGRLEHESLNEDWAIAVRGQTQTDGLVEWGFVPYLPFGFGGTLGVRRGVHDAIGGFDVAMSPAAEDMDYCWRLQHAGWRIRFVPEAITRYRMRADLRTLWKQAYNYGYANVIVYKKHLGLGLGLAPAPHPWRRGVRVWLGLVKRALFAWNKPRRALLVWHAGLRSGMLRASIAHRVPFF